MTGLTWVQARKCCRVRLKSAGRHATCPIGLPDCPGNIVHTRRCYRKGSTNIAFRDIYTLNPANLVELGQKWIDMSSVSHPTLRIFRSGEKQSIPVQLAYAMELRKTWGIRAARETWPLYSQGFLYYFCPFNRPQIAAELRLRLTPTNDPSTFQQGKDLCLIKPNLSGGHPWRRPLYSIATNLNARPLYEKLIEEGLVSPELDKSIQSLPKITLMYSRCQVIHTLYDTFLIDLSSDTIHIAAISESGIATIQFIRQFRDFRVGEKPYSGTVLARFEPSSLPQHANTRTVVLRFVEEITPVRCLIPSYDGQIKRPSPDHLFTKTFHGKVRPWSVDIDSPDKSKLVGTGLKLIWESTPGMK